MFRPRIVSPRLFNSSANARLRRCLSSIQSTPTAAAKPPLLAIAALPPAAAPRRPLVLRLQPAPTTTALQLSRQFTCTAIVSAAAANVPTAQTAKRSDAKTHSPQTELQTDIKRLSEMFGGTPEPALMAGLVGVLPYAATSIATLFLTWDINAATSTAVALKSATASNAYWLDPVTATQWLDILQPIQIGYGAVLLSFLGAIHWGLEFAGMGGHLGFRRYFLGILAPTLAWPTMFLPTNFALMAQFLGFTGMYYADSQATLNGWAPPWYNGYRFVLTFIVCTSIVFSFIVQEYISAAPGARGAIENLKTKKEVGSDGHGHEAEDAGKKKKTTKKGRKNKDRDDE